MKPLTIAKLSIILLVAVAALAILIAVYSGGPEDPGGGNGGKVAPPEAALPSLPCVVRVNEARSQRLDVDSPLYIQCVITNPQADREIALPVAEQFRLILRAKTGPPLGLAWRPVGNAPSSLAPGGRAIYTWQAAGRLAAGEYQATVQLPDKYALAAHGFGDAAIEPAIVRVLTTPPAAQRNAVFARRLLLLGGDAAGAVAQLDKLLTASPDRIDLRIELADAHHAAGSPAEARRQLLEVGYRLQNAD